MGKKLTKGRKLYLKCEKLWKEIAYVRDGRECMVKKHHPYIRITHNCVMQVDHCFSRRDKNLFFDPRNSTVVCGSCNQAKGFKNKSVDRAIDEVVIEREGLLAFEEMKRINQTGKPNTGWGKVWWLEEQVEKLQECLEKLEAKDESVK